MARPDEMKIERIYVYPIKSFRAIELPSATLLEHGFPYDRCFMLLRIVDDKETGGKTYKNMAVAEYNEMVRFFPTFNSNSTDTAEDEGNPTMNIAFHPVDGSETRSIDIPLHPSTDNLEEIDVMMHLSPTKAYKMPAEYNAWLSKCFGFEVILAYISDHLRAVRMSADKYKTASTDSDSNSRSWSLSTLANKATHLLTTLTNTTPDPVHSIRFSDVAPYLIVSSRSMDDVLPRLPPSEQNSTAFDITKFRPNIVVSGAPEPWDEDFWGELTISDDTRLELEHNCGRCRSINIDYATGRQGTGEAGKMLKKLMGDRRVDRGTKWSPVFGRYAFVHPDSEGREICVGDGVRVSRRNGERTAFDWQGLSTLPGGGRD